MYEILEVAVRQHTHIAFDETSRHLGRSEGGHQWEVGGGNSDKGGEIPKGGDGSSRQEARMYRGPYIPWIFRWERSFHFFDFLPKHFVKVVFAS